MNSRFCKIGIFGGTFNPIHYGHLMIAEYACEEYSLDQMVFLPTGHSPHKEYAGSDMQYHRYRMCELAISTNPRFSISSYEIERNEISYTYQTLAHFESLYPEAQLYFVIGADSLKDFPTWRHPELIVERAVILIAGRDDWNKEALDLQIRKLQDRYNGTFFEIHSPLFSAASSDLRSRIMAGRSVRYQTPECVIEYIHTHKLYLKGSNDDEYDL